MGAGADALNKSMLFLVRHGKTKLNEEHRLRGWKDVPLSAAGKAEAHVAAKKLDKALPKKNRVVVSSTLKRAVTTGSIIAKHIGAHMHQNPNLRPWNIGKMSGLPSEEGEKKLSALKKSGKAPAGGETYEAFAARWKKGLDHLKAMSKAGKNVVGVTHFRNVHAATGNAEEPGDVVKIE